MRIYFLFYSVDTDRTTYNLTKHFIMADPLTYTQLLENSKEIDELLQSDNLNEEEKEELEYIWNNLKSEKNLNLMQLSMSLKTVINKYNRDKKKLMN